MTTPLVALLYPHKHRTYVEDHDMDEKSKTTRKKRGPNDVDMLMVRPIATERLSERGYEKQASGREEVENGTSSSAVVS
jgi:hypothetical protein